MTNDPNTDVPGAAEAPDASMSVFQAINLVMRDVTVLRKMRENTQGSGFMFRGIDDVMNAVGPVFRDHGVICLPTKVLSHDVEHATTRSGAGMTVTRVKVEYTFVGPRGDTLVGEAVGEAFDSGDKSTAKAMSVAYRTFLLQSLTLPTDQPDPDETTAELAPRDQTERQALPPSGPAQRSRGAAVQQTDPWRKDLLPGEKQALSDLMGVDDVQKLTAAYHEARKVQEEFVYLAVKPTDVTPAQAAMLKLDEPTLLIEVVTRVGKHLAEAGISVNEDIRANAEGGQKS